MKVEVNNFFQIYVPDSECQLYLLILYSSIVLLIINIRCDKNIYMCVCVFIMCETTNQKKMVIIPFM